jgi:phage protein D
LSEAAFNRTAPTILVMARSANAEPTPIDVSDRVLSLSFEDSDNKADKCTLAVNNFDLTQFDAEHWRTGSKLVVSWGYGGRFALPREITVTKNTGSVQLKIEGNVGSILMHRETRNRIYENLKVSEVVEAVAEENGFGPDAQWIDDTEVVHESIQQAKQTDAQFLTHLARREGFKFYVDFDGLHFHPERFGQQPVREFVYYLGEVGDIQSFSIENDITRRPGGVRVQGRNPETKEDIDETADDESTADETRLAQYKETYLTAGQRLGAEE